MRREDDRRVTSVTGVQTCALPLSGRNSANAAECTMATRAPDYAYFLADSGARVAIVHSAALSEFLPAGQGTPLEREIGRASCKGAVTFLEVAATSDTGMDAAQTRR